MGRQTPDRASSSLVHPMHRPVIPSRLNESGQLISIGAIGSGGGGDATASSSLLTRPDQQLVSATRYLSLLVREIEYVEREANEYRRLYQTEHAKTTRLIQHIQSIQPMRLSGGSSAVASAATAASVASPARGVVQRQYQSQQHQQQQQQIISPLSTPAITVSAGSSLTPAVAITSPRTGQRIAISVASPAPQKPVRPHTAPPNRDRASAASGSAALATARASPHVAKGAARVRVQGVAVASPSDAARRTQQIGPILNSSLLTSYLASIGAGGGQNHL